MTCELKSFDEPLITLDDVTLRVGREWLFEHTNWVIKSDQHWAITGPNGSGKSILVKAICHEVTIVHGRIIYFISRDSGGVRQARPYFNKGEIVKLSPEAHKNLMRPRKGYHQARWQSIEGQDSPTVSALLTGESIERISLYNVTPMKVNEEVYRERRRKAVALLGIEYLLERKIIHVSNGEAKKVLIARALMQSPKLLILDDPFCGLDSSSRETMKNAINDLLVAGNPRVLLVTSRIEEIPPGITHILCVAENRVVDTVLRNELPEIGFGQLSSVPNKSATDMPSALQFPSAHRERIESYPILVEMKDTSVSYGGVDVLRNINWTMKQGENWAVLGPNGAGKTTLLSLILADNPQAYKNAITLFGRRRGSGESIWDIKRKIGWVSPELQIYYHRNITCHNVVCSGFFDSVGLYRAYSPDQAGTAMHWMKSLGIAELSSRPLSTVSVGEQRLVLLARALVKNPVLLILDEPCQGLDFSDLRRINVLLDQLCSGTLVNLIYVTHHSDEMPKAITHILKLERGRIREKPFNSKTEI
ncbi:MAG: ATP-binding cassette domain-containing protein [Deltaproteobacteria bacterium]|nr:ATP-binding cassette domain-containing protein [Deltaproteobacteria bacterium]